MKLPKLTRPKQTLRQACAITLMTMSMVFGLAEPAAAQTFQGALNNIINNVFGGSTILALATLAIIITAIGWLLGMLDLRRAAITVIGIVVVGSAAELAGMILGS
ncbi:TrbC/VirB2 family protein [Inquilinus sp. NPDC058860]|uniref:TrbC/VirB2 family protein n=1 Tax=Inquilinus sp. NPDC058860 TaxID=3346652 RepID=UPI0036830C66